MKKTVHFPKTHLHYFLITLYRLDMFIIIIIIIIIIIALALALF